MGKDDDLYWKASPNANSNIGVIQTTVAEVVRVKEHQRMSSTYSKLLQ